MTSRRIKLLTYWNFVKLTKRLPTKAERTIIKSVAYMAEETFEALMNEPPALPAWLDDGREHYYGFPVIVDDHVRPGSVFLVADPPEGPTACFKCHDTGFVLVHGPEDYGVSFESEACECEIGQSYVRAEETLCGCGHGDVRTCPCEEIDDLPADLLKHPSKETGQFDHHESHLNLTGHGSDGEDQFS